MNSTTESAAAVAEAFEKLYGTPPHWIAAAPGRVNVIGEHTDYNDGFVLPMAIDRYTLIAAAPNGSEAVRIRSDAAEEPTAIDLSQPIRPERKFHWSNYPRGVLAAFSDLGLKPPGFNALVQSTVPVGGGLSSSAALLVATATLLEAMAGRSLDPFQKVLLCQKAEHEFAGVPSGIMDHCISILGREGHLLLLDCRSHAAEPVPLTDPAISILIVNTNVRHELASGEYAVRRAQCATAAETLNAKSLREVTLEQLERARDHIDRTVFRRARHAISEIARTCEAAKRVKAGEWREVGQLMYASHESLKNDYEVSCSELDSVVEIARNIGVQGGLYGCRMTGGGFGGCAVALIATDARDEIAATIRANYLKLTGIEPTLFVSRPAGGAHLVEV